MKFISRVEQDISFVHFSDSLDALLNTRNRFLYFRASVCYSLSDKLVKMDTLTSERNLAAR